VSPHFSVINVLLYTGARPVLDVYSRAGHTECAARGAEVIENEPTQQLQ
jgi:hypothetical protein